MRMVKNILVQPAKCEHFALRNCNEIFELCVSVICQLSLGQKTDSIWIAVKLQSRFMFEPWKTKILPILKKFEIKYLQFFRCFNWNLGVMSAETSFFEDEIKSHHDFVHL